MKVSIIHLTVEPVVRQERRNSLLLCFSLNSDEKIFQAIESQDE